jgi:hypothetical protein
LIDGTATVGTTTKYAREDHVHPTDTTRAALTQVVRYDAVQSLTAAQQLQARQNIYAAPFDALAYNGMQINGSMEVSQENGTSPVGVSATAKYILDGWSVWNNGAQVVTGVQNPASPAGHTASLQAYPTTANAAPLSNDFCVIYQWIEGYRVSRLGFGAVGAASVTIGFWVTATRAGTYSVVLRNAALNRSCPVAYTVTAPSTWEYKTVTFPGDTTGTWVKNNTSALMVAFTAMAGSGQVTTAGVWSASPCMGATGTTNCVASTSDTMLITGVVVLPGIEAPSAARSPLIMRPYDQELATCQRYWQKVTSMIVETNILCQSFVYPVQMRAAPVITGGGAGFGLAVLDNVSMLAFQTARGVQTLVFDARL